MKIISKSILSAAFLLTQGILLLSSCHSEEKHMASAPLVIRSAMVTDSLGIDDAALFLMDEKDSIYNDCECTQNVPVLCGGNDVSILEDLDIYSQVPATVYAYSPFHLDAKVDSIPWNLGWNDDLLIADVCTATSHRNKVDLSFRHVMGCLCFFMDEEIAGDIFLEGSFPQEGFYDLLAGTFTVTRQEHSMTLSDCPMVTLVPGKYKNVKIRYGQREYVLDIPIKAGHLTTVTIDAKSGTPILNDYDW